MYPIDQGPGSEGSETVTHHQHSEYTKEVSGAPVCFAKGDGAVIQHFLEMVPARGNGSQNLMLHLLIFLVDLYEGLTVSPENDVAADEVFDLNCDRLILSPILKNHHRDQNRQNHGNERIETQKRGEVVADRLKGQNDSFKGCHLSSSG